MIKEFLQWWLEQLRELAPAQWREDRAAAQDCLLLKEEYPTVVGSLRRRGKVQPLGRFAIDQQGAAMLADALSRLARRALPVVLSPSAAQCLRKTISLPHAARRNLGQALAFEMDRQTPFRADEIAWRYRVLGIDRVRERIEIELMLVPRHAIARICEFAQAAGLRAAAVEIAEGEGRVSRIGLQDQRPRGEAKVRRLDMAVAGLAALLAIMAVALPFLRLGHALSETQADIARLQPVADRTLALHTEAERLTTVRRFIAAERVRVRDPLLVLAAATQALPDTTYLTEFAMRGEQATLVGLSPSAASLIAGLAAAGPFRDPTFGAPVVRPDGGKLEMFTIRSSLNPTSGPTIGPATAPAMAPTIGPAAGPTTGPTTRPSVGR